jgi:transposase
VIYRGNSNRIADITDGTSHTAAFCQRLLTDGSNGIARGSKMGPGGGWFHLGQSRYGWDWLAERFDADDGTIEPGEFRGPTVIFTRLDRDRSGSLSAGDLDWSDDAPFVQRQDEAYRLFRRMATRDGTRAAARAAPPGPVHRRRQLHSGGWWCRPLRPESSSHGSAGASAARSASRGSGRRAGRRDRAHAPGLWRPLGKLGRLRLFLVVHRSKRMRAYSAEMRRDVLDMDQAGVPTHEIAIELNVSKSWVRRVKQEYRQSGKTAPATTRTRSRFVEEHRDWLQAHVDGQADIDLRELQALAALELGLEVSLMTLCRALNELKLTRKKRR